MAFTLEVSSFLFTFFSSLSNQKQEHDIDSDSDAKRLMWNSTSWIGYTCSVYTVWHRSCVKFEEYIQKNPSIECHIRFFCLPLLFQFACVIFENNVVIKLYFMHLQKTKRKNSNEKTFRLVELTSNNIHSLFIRYYFLLCLSAMRANLILSNRRHTQPFLYFAFSG